MRVWHESGMRSQAIHPLRAKKRQLLGLSPPVRPPPAIHDMLAPPWREATLYDLSSRRPPPERGPLGHGSHRVRVGLSVMP